jgi:hypothetical protein
MSKNSTTNAPPSIQDVSGVDATKGGSISSSNADLLISAYKTNFIDRNGLPSNTTIGGVIGRDNLKSVVEGGTEDLVKFRFYLTSNAAGEEMIGLMFYPSANATSLVRTGSESFCPPMCD